MKTLLTCVLAVLLIPFSVRAADAPFVAGFDRFLSDRPEHVTTAGDLLLSELSCTACHSTPRLELAAKRGPMLDGAAERLSSTWLKSFLKSPSATKPGTTMPDVLHGLDDVERGKSIDALIAFLSSSRPQFPVLTSTASNPIALEVWRKGDAIRGRQLYHQIGCVACHDADDDYEAAPKKTSDLEKLLKQLPPEEIEELGLADAARPVRSVPHGDLSAKYSRHSLTMFLLDPAIIRPSGRMPGFKLAPHDAADLTAYLLQKQPQSVAHQFATPVEQSPELVEQGRKLFNELRCSACHDLKGLTRPGTPLARPLADVQTSRDSGCFSTGEPVKTGQPKFELDARQIAAIQQAFAGKSGSDTAPDMLALRMLQLNCFACHERGNRGGVGPNRRGYFETTGFVDLGDEGRLPPPLDHVGRKLTQSSLQAVFKGTGDIRPHLLARMPVFAGLATSSLPKLFRAADHSTGTDTPQPSEQDLFGSSIGTAKAREAGRQLLDTGCVQCHPLRGERLPGVLGIDLAEITKRIEPLWFQEFLRNPAQLKPRTRMPTFFPNGRSANQVVLDGDRELQIAALWSYLRDAEKLPLPDKIETGKAHNFELVATDRPVLLRTFMKDAGNHAIAVAYPGKLNLAFDAESARVAQFWRGSFLNAHGTWYDRFTPPAVPLGSDLIALPTGPSIAVLATASTPWPVVASQFRGYRLDSAGTPTFLYRTADFEVQDRFETTSNNGFKRRIKVSRRHGASRHAVWFRALSGKTLRPAGQTVMTNETGLSVSIESENVTEMRRRELSGQMEWLIPLAGEIGELTVFYHW